MRITRREMVTMVHDRVINCNPLPLNFGPDSISPREISATYWNDGSGLCGVAVYGPKLLNGKLTELLCKKVYWDDTLSTAPGWVQDFVSRNLSS